MSIVHIAVMLTFMFISGFCAGCFMVMYAVEKQEGWVSNTKYGMLVVSLASGIISLYIPFIGKL